MKTKIIIAIAALAAFPAVALAGPIIGLGYSDIGLSGHSGRPGIQISAGNLYHHNVVASGSATFARGYYQMDAAIGKIVQTRGTVSFEPYLSAGFLNLNYNQQETGYTTSQVNSGYGFSYTQSTPYSYTQANSIQDFYGLAGANLNIPLGSKVGLEFGGGFGHTLMAQNGNGGAVYKGEAKAGFKIARHVTANINVAYLHLPGASLTSYGAGLAYHF